MMQIAVRPLQYESPFRVAGARLRKLVCICKKLGPPAHVVLHLNSVKASTRS